MAGDQSGISWRAGPAGEVPVSDRFDDPFYSLEDGLAETRHVFLAGNGLPGRLRAGFHVAELGVGTGLNLLALAEAAEAAGVTGLRYTGFEAFPLSRGDLGRALGAFPALGPQAARLLDAWDPAGWSARIGPVHAEMIAGDARRTLPGWSGRAQAWFLDGFAPARNPELWEAGLMAAVAARTSPGGSFATYTAAGEVRRALAAAGFKVTRVPGYGRKRHMTIGRLPADPAP